MKENELSTIEQLLDENNVDPVTLYDADENEVTFDQVALIPIGEKTYVILCPITPMEGVGEDEGVVFLIDEQNGEECLTLIVDDETIDAVFAEYDALVAREEAED